eukprot:COSAG02_NODE_4992_length_4742_cov_8.191040_6_plen_70_part_00
MRTGSNSGRSLDEKPADDWRRQAEELYEEHGFTLSALRRLPPDEQGAGLVDAGLSPVQCVRVFVHLEAS